MYYWPINDSFHAGIPDHYYSGRTGDLWAEYKYFPVDQVAFNLTCPAKNPKLTRLQQNWLNSRYDEGRCVWVVVGMPSGGVILRDKEWMEEYIIQQVLTRQEIAAQIMSCCNDKSRP